ncbi:MAG: RrF2 family transcriptional regulator [Verrucomicrobiales bacterium]
MQLSRQTDYALRALMTLAEAWGGRPISINELSQRNEIPKKFLEQIMLRLKTQGWVRSVPGKHGGYCLHRPPGDIAMGAVVRHFDGCLAPIGCVSSTDYQACTQESRCRFRRVLLRVRNLVVDLMDQATLADLLKDEPVTWSEVAQHKGLFGDGI